VTPRARAQRGAGEEREETRNPKPESGTGVMRAVGDVARLGAHGAAETAGRKQRRATVVQILKSTLYIDFYVVNALGH
jgi:hypothetical protein